MGAAVTRFERSEHLDGRERDAVLEGAVADGGEIADKLGPDIYGTALLTLPTPRYVVLYNGLADIPAEKTLRLSDAYSGEGDVEVIAHVVNVNADSGAVALRKCRELAGYAELVARVRKNARTMEFSEAVDLAVKSCIADGILASYLRARRAEVKDMFMTEYDEEQVHEWIREQGVKQGIKQGQKDMLLANLENLMSTMGLDEEKAMDALRVPEESRARYHQLLDSARLHTS